jgi:hypothetical protein
MPDPLPILADSLTERATHHGIENVSQDHAVQAALQMWPVPQVQADLEMAARAPNLGASLSYLDAACARLVGLTLTLDALIDWTIRTVDRHGWKAPERLTRLQKAYDAAVHDLTGGEHAKAEDAAPRKKPKS